MNIALFPGDFDPLHNGHILLIRQTFTNFKNIDEIWIIPSHKHKYAHREFLTDRNELINLYLNKENFQGKLKLKDFYNDLLLLPGTKYELIDSIVSLPGNEKNKFYYILGTDEAEETSSWSNMPKIDNMVTFIIYPREPIKKPISIRREPHIFFIGAKSKDFSCSNIKMDLNGGFLNPDDIPEEIYEVLNDKYQNKAGWGYGYNTGE